MRLRRSRERGSGQLAFMCVLLTILCMAAIYACTRESSKTAEPLPEKPVPKVDPWTSIGEGVKFHRCPGGWVYVTRAGGICLVPKEK